MKKLLWLPAIVLLVLSAAASAQVKSYKIYENSNTNDVVAAAVDSNKGDILVAWSEVVENSADFKDIRIWFSFLKRNPNGTYTPAAAKLLSEKGESARNLSVAYSPVSKSFLIAYTVGISKPVAVYAAIFKNGKIRNPRELWVEETGFAVSTMVAVGLNKKNKIPGKKAAFVIARRAHVPSLGTISDRIHLFPVSSKGKNTGTPILMQGTGSTEESNFGAQVRDIEIGTDGTIYITLKWFPGPGKISIGTIVTKKDGSFKALATLKGNQDKNFSFFMNIAVASKKTVFVAWKHATETLVHYQTINNKGKVLDDARDAFDVAAIWHDYEIVTDSKGTVYLYKFSSSEGGSLYKLGKNGNIVDTVSFGITVPRIAHYSMAAIPKNNELMLVSNMNAGDGKTGIVVSVIKPAELF